MEMEEVRERWYLSPEKFDWLIKELLKRGFELVGTANMFAEIKRERAVKYLKTKNKGIEEMYELSVNGKVIRVCTTRDRSSLRVRKNDTGWVLLKDRRDYKHPFFPPPRLRTLNYVKHLLEWVDTCIHIALHWPKCPQCGEDLFQRFVPKIVHMVKFVCRKPEHGIDPPFFIIDINIPDQYSELLFGWFKGYYEREQKDLLAGIVKVPTRFSRAKRKKEAESLYAEKNDPYGDLKHEVPPGETYFYDD